MNKKVIISSVAVFSAVALAGCGGTDLAQQAQDEATKTATQAQEAVQQTNEDYVATKQEVKDIKDEAMQEVKETTKDTVVDAAKDIADTTKDQMKQDMSALEDVATAAGAKYTAAMLTKYKNDAAKSVGPAAVANSIENTKKNDATFVVEVVSVDGTKTEVYLDADGKVMPSTVE